MSPRQRSVSSVEPRPGAALRAAGGRATRSAASGRATRPAASRRAALRSARAAGAGLFEKPAARRRNASRGARARATLEESGRRYALERHEAAKRIGRARVAPRSPNEVRRSGKVAVRTKARGGRRAGRRGVR